VGFNLIFIVPGLALAVWCAIETAREEGAWSNLLNHMILPGIVGTFLILALPLAHAEAQHFYLGEKTLRGSVLTVSQASLLQGMHWFPGESRSGTRGYGSWRTSYPGQPQPCCSWGFPPASTPFCAPGRPKTAVWGRR
jgi:hypothetical protein